MDKKKNATPLNPESLPFDAEGRQEPNKGWRHTRHAPPPLGETKKQPTTSKKPYDLPESFRRGGTDPHGRYRNSAHGKAAQPFEGHSDAYFTPSYVYSDYATPIDPPAYGGLDPRRPEFVPSDRSHNLIPSFMGVDEQNVVYQGALQQNYVNSQPPRSFSPGKTHSYLSAASPFPAPTQQYLTTIAHPQYPGTASDGGRPYSPNAQNFPGGRLPHGFTPPIYQDPSQPWKGNSYPPIQLHPNAPEFQPHEFAASTYQPDYHIEDHFPPPSRDGRSTHRRADVKKHIENAPSATSLSSSKIVQLISMWQNFLTADLHKARDTTALTKLVDESVLDSSIPVTPGMHPLAHLLVPPPRARYTHPAVTDACLYALRVANCELYSRLHHLT